VTTQIFPPKAGLIKFPCRPGRLWVTLFHQVNSTTPNRPASSNYRWVICGLLFFATTFNYMDRQVISYLKDYFCRPAHQAGDPQTFSAGDFRDLPSLAGKLKQPAGAISVYLKTNLSAATLAALADYHGSGSDTVSV
jgi:hypothetical protein